MPTISQGHTLAPGNDGMVFEYGHGKHADNDYVGCTVSMSLSTCNSMSQSQSQVSMASGESRGKSDGTISMLLQSGSTSTSGKTNSGSLFSGPLSLPSVPSIPKDIPAKGNTLGDESDEGDDIILLRPLNQLQNDKKVDTSHKTCTPPLGFDLPPCPTPVTVGKSKLTPYTPFAQVFQTPAPSTVGSGKSSTFQGWSSTLSSSQPLSERKDKIMDGVGSDQIASPIDQVFSTSSMFGDFNPMTRPQ